LRMKILLATVAVLGAGLLSHADTPRQVTLTWYGHACFMITTPQGSTILTDPIDLKDYKVPADVTPDIVTVSHNHGDHDAVGTVSGEPLVIYGQDREGQAPHQAIIPVDTTVKGVRIYNVVSNHFPPEHSPMLNAIFVFEFDSLRVVHLGDLGLTLTPEQIERIGRVDVLMIPVGGKYTIAQESADSVVAQLKPTRVVIPMHFRTRVADFVPYTADDFVKGKANVERIPGNQYAIDLSAPSTGLKYVVFDCFK